MKEAIISRTIITNYASVLFYNAATKAAESCVVTLPAAIDNADRAERYIRKNADSIPGKLIVVEEVQRAERLVGMELSVFMANAKAVTERDKTTRGTITKTVPGFACEVLYMDADHKIQRLPVTVPAVKDIDRYCKANIKVPGYYVTVENVTPTETLYSMSESTFIALAKPMKNKFSLA